MNYRAKKDPDGWSWAVFLNDKQITYYQFEKSEAEALASAKQREQEQLIENAILGVQ